MKNTLTLEDIEILDNKGISVEELECQIQNFKDGFPFLDIINAASIEKGVKVIKANEIDRYIAQWDKYRGEKNNQIIKFIPASGAATRMFKDLFEFLETISDLPENKYIQTFFINLQKFAFYSTLEKTILAQTGRSLEDVILNNEYKMIINTLLSEEGLGYGSLPKGLLLFHSYEDGGRTSFEEHLVEGAMYSKSAENVVNLHFTVSKEHHALYLDLLTKVQSVYEQLLDVKFNISFSEQKSKTDTVAVNLDNTPFRENGKLLFRPGGHGALIENLNDLDVDIIFIKNIDNVVPDRLKRDETTSKKILAGYLVDIQKKIFEYLEVIDSGNYTQDQLLEILYFVQNELNTRNKEIKYLEDVELVLYLKQKLNRPIRVCGMVRNLGEPGGGPFFAVNQDQTISLQILESVQIDMEDPQKVEILESSTFFNPVDLVCAVKDYQGNKFDLTRFVDKNTGFISRKSKNGKELKALELPGLWNGAMSDWNTIFVEVPISTFNPVKTVNDLLRKEHQN